LDRKRVQGLGVKVQGLGLRVQGFGVRAQGLGVRVRHGVGPSFEGSSRVVDKHVESPVPENTFLNLRCEAVPRRPRI
jgi:hypothetical protein